MAPLIYWLRQSLLVCLIFLFINQTIISALSSSHHRNQLESYRLLGNRRTRMLLEIEDDEDEEPKPKPKPIIKKQPSSSTSTITTKNQTKLIKPTSTSTKNLTKLIKTTSTSTTTSSTSSSKNQTKLIKPLSGLSKNNKTKLIKTKTSTSEDSIEEDDSSKQPPIKIKKLNSTSASTTKSTSVTAKKSSDPTKLTTSSKNKTTKATTTTTTTATKDIKVHIEKPKSNEALPKKKQQQQQQQKPNWIDEDDDDDLISEFRGLPSKFQSTFVPDLERISKTSRNYLTKYNKEITRNFKPYVGNKYAPTIASFASFAFIILPLILVSLVFHRIKAYFSLQKLLIFIQVYLAIYFTILCLSSLVTGLEPLRFFYSTSQSTYVCVQVLQTLAYVLYLLLLLMYLVLVFSTETGLVTKMLGLGQTFVGFAVGLHYYINVFHRAVLHQPPRSSWKVHGLYATCFVVICLLGKMDRRKKAYLEEGGEEGKKS